MAKIVLAFEGRILRDYPLDKEEVTIGRDPDCDIRVESLQVMPWHARIRRQGSDYRILAENLEKPLLVHHTRVTDQLLAHDDVIQLGNYSLTFAEDQYNFLEISQDPVNKPEQKTSKGSGYLKILSGPRAGRTIPLKQSLTRLGLTNEESVMVAHRHEGYFLSLLKGEAYPQVNGETIDDEAVKLEDGDEVTIGLTLLRFYSE